jgi:hypothetical protein
MSQRPVEAIADPVLSQLARLATPAVSAEVSRKIRVAALPALRLRPVHPAWIFAVAGTAAGYFGSALYFTLRLFQG